jgi:hypothetical protein
MVTDENFGELLIEGLEEVAAHQRGERPWFKTVRRFVPPRFGTCPEEGPEDDQESPPQDHTPRNRLRP